MTAPNRLGLLLDVKRSYLKSNGLASYGELVAIVFD